MTKYVLLVGVLVAASLTLIWLVFTVLPALPNTGMASFDSILQTLRIFAAVNRYNDRAPFTGIGPVFKLWFVCLLIAVVSDKVIKPPARAVISAFAAALSPEAGQAACEVQQYADWKAIIQTTTSGSFRGRGTTVLVYQRPRLSYLSLEMACHTPLVFDIRNRNLLSRALAFVGAPVETEDKALDEAVLIQGNDEVAIRKWVQAPGVRPRILSLFQLYKITSLTTEAGTVLCAYRARFRPRLFPTEHAVGILDDVAELAATAEAGHAPR